MSTIDQELAARKEAADKAISLIATAPRALAMARSRAHDPEAFAVLIGGVREQLEGALKALGKPEPVEAKMDEIEVAPEPAPEAKPKKPKGKPSVE